MIKVTTEDLSSSDGAVRPMPASGKFDLFLATVFINVLSLALPIMLLQVYDRIIPNAASGTLALLVIGVGVALLLEAVFRVIRSYIGAWEGARFEHRTGCRMLERLARASTPAFERVGAAVHLERFNAISTLRDYFSGQPLLVFCDLPFALLFLVAIGYLAGFLVVVPIVLITLFALAATVMGGKLRRALDARAELDDRRFNFVIEVLNGIHTVKGLAMEEQMLRRYERIQDACAERGRDVARYSASATSIGSLFSHLTMFSVVGLGAILVIDGGLTVGGLAACTLLAGRAMQPLQRAVGVWTRFQSLRLALDRVRDAMALETESGVGLTALPSALGDIKFSGVSFSYAPDEPPILNDVDLHIRRGETVGIAGTNSSGKSTLLMLAAGLLRPTAGLVTVDGKDLAAFDPDSIAREIAYLPQHAVLFNGSIMENLTMFRPRLHARAKEVARWLGLHDVVSRMPLGYETRVGDSASDSVARGVKQRIAIARALVDGPHIILFDEANTAMDSRGDAAVKALLESMKGDHTLVLVTRRPSLLKLADRVFDLDGGRVVEHVSAVPNSSSKEKAPKTRKTKAPQSRKAKVS